MRAFRAIAFASFLGLLFLALASGHVPCIFARIFHAPCPGCGSTRAMLALASGDLPALLRYNPLAPLMTTLVVILATEALRAVLSTGTFRGVAEGKLGTLIAGAAAVVAGLEVLVWLARFGGFLGGPVPV